MDLIKNWKIHVLALIIVAIAEFIGVQKFGLIVLLPLLYSLVIGAILSFPRWNFINPPRWSAPARCFRSACCFS